MQPNKELLLLDRMLTKVVNRVTLIPTTMLQEMLDEFYCCLHNGTFIELLLSSQGTALFKVIPLQLFYYQTFFESWHNQHS